MTEITMDTIKALRERSGVGMMDCKKALAETGGDLEAAIDYLRKKGLATASKKSDRTASQGLVGLAVHEGHGILVEINCETDFVARNEKFQNFVRSVAEKALVSSSLDNLKTQTLENNRSVEDTLTDMIASIGENMALRNLVSLDVSSGVIAGYVHGQEAPNMGKIGVLVALETSDTSKAECLELGKQLAMHVAASNPSYAKRSDVDENALNRERTILTEQAQSSGKPPEVIEKMVEGRMRKFYEEHVLEEQVFVIDNETKIKDLIANTAKNLGISISLSGFASLHLGQTS
jgi:elongation factor Ts